MKRFVLTVAMAVMTMTMAFADNEENNSSNNVSAYQMNISMHSLGKALNLSSDQYDFVEDAINIFSEDMMSISAAEGADRLSMVHNAVKKNLALTKGILTRAQYQKYVMLLNLTLNNRGLNK